MNDVVRPSLLLESIDVPRQELTRLGFCGSTKLGAVREWVDSLQATKVLQTSTMLYQAVPEIARLKTDYQNRYELLEAMRPSVQYAILGLQKTFLNQPLVMPPEAQKAVAVAQALQKAMIDGYIVCAVQITHKGRANTQTLDLLTNTIHRAISGIGLLFFRNYQIYAQTPASLWSVLHILYQVAEFYKLTYTPVIDPTLKTIRALSINAAYARVLLLASARTNQLSQTDIDMAFTAFESWCQAVKFSPGLDANSENFFAINLSSSQGPVYKSKVINRPIGRYLEIDTSHLLNQLSKQSTDTDQIIEGAVRVKIANDFPQTLLDHLLQAWSNVSQRRYDRRAVESAAEVAVGLMDCHYFLCNGQEFDVFLRSSGSHEPQHISRFSQGLTAASHLNDYQNSNVPIHRVSIQNVSAGGYCLLWQDNIPTKVSAGELIGVKEMGKRTWSIGAVRWVRQLKSASQLGVQLLSHNAKPYGIAQTYNTGAHSEYMRALFLPPSKFGYGHPTVLTAAIPFQEFDKVRIIDGDKEWNAKLERLAFSTKNIQQFRFRRAEDDASTDSGHQKTSQSFDSSWE